MLSPRRILTIIPFLAMAAFGCGSGDRSAGFSVTDSAGVTIAISTGPSWQASEGWVFADQPSVDIGVVDGAADYQLFRVANTVRMTNGNIVVANSGTQEIRCYDTDGNHVWSAGGEGGGPGEFERLYRIAVFADSIIAFDSRYYRVSVFDTSGVYVRSATLDDPKGVLNGVFSDGSLLMTESDIRTQLQRRVLGDREEIDDGSVRLNDIALRHSGSGEFLDSLRLFPGAEGVIGTRASGDQIAVSFSYKPFGRSAVFAVRDNHLLAGTQDRYEIATYAMDGELVSLLRRDFVNRTITDRHIDLLRDQYLDGIEDADAIRERTDEFQGLPKPETMPAYRSIIVDSDGLLWVEEYRLPDEAPEWTVFDHDLRMLGTVKTPLGLTVHQIGKDFVLGTWRDEFDVEHVRLHDLVRQ